MDKRLGILLLAAPLAVGCSAVTSTTNTVAKGMEAATGAITEASQSTTDASVTEPGTPEYARAEAFVASQMPYLRREAAAGGGENLRALAELIGARDPEAFGQWAQAHYETLFTDLREPGQLLVRIGKLRG